MLFLQRSSVRDRMIQHIICCDHPPQCIPFHDVYTKELSTHRNTPPETHTTKLFRLSWWQLSHVLAIFRETFLSLYLLLACLSGSVAKAFQNCQQNNPNSINMHQRLRYPRLQAMSRFKRNQSNSRIPISQSDPRQNYCSASRSNPSIPIWHHQVQSGPSIESAQTLISHFALRSTYKVHILPVLTIDELGHDLSLGIFL